MYDLALTPGTIVTAAAVEYPSLGIEVPLNSPSFEADLLELGLASTFRRGDPVLATLWRSPSRAAVVPGSLGASLVVALSHYARGMYRTLACLVVLGAIGAVTGQFSFMALALAGALFVSSVLVHELGHVVAYRTVVRATAPAIVVARGMKCHLVRLRLPPIQDLVVAAAGPLAPGALLPLFVPILWGAPLIFYAWCAIALGHAMGAIMPWGDGATIWAAAVELREARRSPSSLR